MNKNKNKNKNNEHPNTQSLPYMRYLYGKSYTMKKMMVMVTCNKCHISGDTHFQVFRRVAYVVVVIAQPKPNIFPNMRVPTEM